MLGGRSMALFRFRGIPPAWSSALSELGYSESQIALILKGHRDRIPNPSSVLEHYASVTPARSSRL